MSRRGVARYWEALTGQRLSRAGLLLVSSLLLLALFGPLLVTDPHAFVAAPLLARSGWCKRSAYCGSTPLASVASAPPSCGWSSGGTKSSAGVRSSLSSAESHEKANGGGGGAGGEDKRKRRSASWSSGAELAGATASGVGRAAFGTELDAGGMLLLLLLHKQEAAGSESDVTGRYKAIYRG